MRLGRIDDGDVQIGRTAQQAGGNSGACRATADNDDVVACNRLVRFDCAAFGHALHHAGDIVSGQTGTVDDVIGGTLARFSQGPKRGGTGAAAAVGQNRLGQFGHCGGKSCSVGVADLTGGDGHIARLQPGGGGRCRNLGEGRLVRALTIRPVANDRPEACGSQICHFRGADLPRDRQFFS